MREHQFLAADQEGVVWVHGYGNVFEKQLDPGETIDIEPGGWVYRDHSVSMSQEVYGFKTGLLSGGGNLVQHHVQDGHKLALETIIQAWGGALVIWVGRILGGAGMSSPFVADFPGQPLPAAPRSGCGQYPKTFTTARRSSLMLSSGRPGS